MMDFTIEKVVLFIALIFLMSAFVLTLYRLIKGPTLHDRVVALDLMASINIGFVLLYSMLVNKTMYFDIAVVISLISFVGTVGFSTYLKQLNQ